MRLEIVNTWWFLVKMVMSLGLVKCKVQEVSFCHFQGSQTYPTTQVRFKNKDEAIEFLCRPSGYGRYIWVKSDHYVNSWWNGVDSKSYNNIGDANNASYAIANIRIMARDSADSDSHTIDLTPSPKGYASMLEILINCSPIAANVEWATAELEAWEKADPEIVARDSAWDDEKLSYAIELLSEEDLVKYQEWVDSQDGDWNGDGTISFANANAKLDYDMRN